MQSSLAFREAINLSKTLSVWARRASLCGRSVIVPVHGHGPFAKEGSCLVEAGKHYVEELISREVMRHFVFRIR
jgi:hypothetical protein